MSMMRLIRPHGRAGGALVLLLVMTQASFGQVVCNDNCCNRWNCPPPYRYCQEGPPKIKIICGCPKPVCCPADAPNWGYFQKCWRPYAWPPDWSYCYGVPPAAQIVPPMADAHMTPYLHDGVLPPPKMMGPRPGL
jgi:hypothetical protein